MTSKEIRETWLNFFQSKGHTILPSKSLIPQNDPSLLWINSGVATLKDYFSGKKIPPAKRLTNSQKSIRTNDIENVGKTSRHHTFFEMLGNFSIGDYFKEEALEFAYEFIFKVLNIAQNKIYITYFDEDPLTKEIWLKLGIESSHIIKGNRDTNFWDVGNGPCGPNTEIFYDRGIKYDSRGIEILVNDIENDRYIEIWNIVFSEFNNDGEGHYIPLKQKNIDTGAGLERIAAILQDVPTNFDTDLFIPIIKAIEKMSPYKYDTNNYFTKELNQELINQKFKIIADHLRTVSNAINDGALPSNVGRGYIIRRLIRRAYRMGLELKINKKQFLANLVAVVAQTLPNYSIDVEHVSQIITNEENIFSQTINQGEELLKNEIKKIVPLELNSIAEIKSYLQKHHSTFDFAIAFKLFETYGFPIELTQEILATDYGINLDISLFDKYLEQHANKSRANSAIAMKEVINSLNLVKSKVSEFIGYTDLKIENTKILYLLDEENNISKTLNNEAITYAILEKTPFYATSGGQRHDKGYLQQGINKILILDVFKDKYLNHIHKVQGLIDISKPISAYVDTNIRNGLERNHSSTHLVFKALRDVFGKEIEQLGSDNNEERLTFDFPCDKRPTIEQIQQAEDLVNSYIAMAVDRKYIITDIQGARNLGAIMTIAEEEYMDPKNVRIVEFKNITSDLCGGTHIKNTHLIEKFKIISLDSKGTGIFRIKALSSQNIVDQYLKEQIELKYHLLENLIKKNMEIDKYYALPSTLELLGLEDQLKKIDQQIIQVREDYKNLIKKQASAIQNCDDIKLENINNKLFYLSFNEDYNLIKNKVAGLRDTHPEAIIIAFANNEKNNMLVVASKKYNAKAISDAIFKLSSGRGGGNAILFQGSIAELPTKEQIIDIIKVWEN